MQREVQLLIFELDGRWWGLHLAAVERVIRAVEITPLPMAPAIVRGIIDVQGQIIPVLNVRGRFSLPDREVGLDDQMIIATTGRRRVAILVDGVREIVCRAGEEIVAAEKILRPLDGIEGVIQLGDGLALIHDLDRFLSLDEERSLENALTMEPAHAG